MHLKNVEDIYPLSPMQETMLFHACTTIVPDVLFNQIRMEISGALDPVAFEQSWQILVDRHAVLRTCFVWQGLKKPQQIVRKKLTIPFTYCDLTEKSRSDIAHQVDEIVEHDRAEPFSLEKAPLTRVILVKLASDLHQLIWSSHHLILDRWSIPILFDELVLCYQSLVEGRLPTPEITPQYKSYINWLQNRKTHETKRYWLEEFSGFGELNPITYRRTLSAQKNEITRRCSINIKQNECEKLKQFCRAQRITLASLIQSSWALVLNRLTGVSDVVFGVVVSGRPIELAGVEETLGSFINNLPVRIKLNSQSSLLEYLQSMQRRAQKRLPFEYVSLTHLQNWCQLAPSQTFFDTLLVWLAPTTIAPSSNLSYKPFSADMTTAYPLTVSIEEKEDTLTISAILDRNYQLEGELPLVLNTFESIMFELTGMDVNKKLVDIADIKTVHNEGHEQSEELEQESFAARHGKSEYGFVSQHELIGAAKSEKLLEGREKLPVNDFIQFLIDKWQEILAVEDISSDDDFFELGGDSLKATILLSHVEQAIRKKIPLLSLFKGRTIKEMATIVLSEDWPLATQLAMPINTRGKRPPLFFIASPEVNTLGFVNLSRQLGDDLPSYILQAPPDAAQVRELHACELPALATKYITAMQQIQPQGPYYLLGMCTGAQLGIEMGRQLEASGEKIGFIGVVNTWGFFTVSKRYYMVKILSAFRYYRLRIKNLTVNQVKDKLKKVITFKVRTQQEQVFCNSQSDNYTSKSNIDINLDYSLINDVGWARLLPNIKKLSAEITVFRLAKQPYWRISDPSLGWSLQAEQVDIINISGTVHLEILRAPQLQHVVTELKAKLVDKQLISIKTSQC